MSERPPHQAEPAPTGSEMHSSHQFMALPRLCYQPSAPQPVNQPQWVAFNQPLAAALGIPKDLWLSDAGAEVFGGNHVPTWAKPIATAYAGHQFGHFNPQLGDGRAVLLCELKHANGKLYDVQLKGSGVTPYSRNGDGRSPLGPVLREYIVSEFMHRIGIPTTRALAAVASGEAVYREQAEPGAVFTRVARSHLRVGSFQYIMVRGDFDALAALADFAISRHYPELAQLSDDDSSDCRSDETPGNRYLGLLDRVIEQQAQLISQWMSVGFIHGVMNTDNTSISGETIDYGPCAFMESYRASQVFSFIDKQGRYAYNQQPAIAHWNMARFAESLLPLIDNDKQAAIEFATELVNSMPQRIEAHWLRVMGRKLGIAEPGVGDKTLIEAFLALLEAHHIDFTLGFRLLSDEVSNHSLPHQVFLNPTETDAAGNQAFAHWRDRWQQRLQLEETTLKDIQARMNAVNPLRIPRNHVIQQVIDAAYEHGDLAPFNQLMAALENPFHEDCQFDDYTQPANPEQQVSRTFCGT
ncbi:MAG: YdiU family protein [Idiomarina sp.]|nr:YdiU family protein [Idiomarina sp.]